MRQTWKSIAWAWMLVGLLAVPAISQAQVLHGKIPAILGTSSNDFSIGLGSNLIRVANAAGSRTGTLYAAALNLNGQYTSTLATGTAPLVVASTTKVSNLNVDAVDGASIGTLTAAGGVAYATSTSALAATAAGTSGQHLLSGGSGAPTWGGLTDAYLWVGNASNIPTAVALSGDATLANTGALSLAAGSVVAAKIGTGAVLATKLQQAGADLGAANVGVDLSNTNASYVTNVTTDGTMTAASFLPTSGIGTAPVTSGLSAVTYGSGANFKTVITLDHVAVTVTRKSGDSSGYGSVLVYTFPEGWIIPIAFHATVSVDSSVSYDAAGRIAEDGSGDWGIGQAVLSDTDLSTGGPNWISSTALTDPFVSGVGSGAVAMNNAAIADCDGHATAKRMYFNVIFDAGDVTGGNTACAVTGTVTGTWGLAGDN